MKKISSSMFCVFFLIFLPAQAQLELFTQLRDLIQNQKYIDAKKMMETQAKSTIPAEDLHLFDFQSAYLDFQLGLYSSAQSKFQTYLSTHSKLKDYAQYFVAISLERQNKDDEAVKSLQEIQGMDINTKLSSQVAKEIGEIHLRKKNFPQAKIAISKAMKILKTGEDAASLLFLMAQVERGQNSETGFCKVIVKLYSEFPHSSVVANWDGNLKENKFQNQKTNCVADHDVFRQRVRYLMWNGMDTRAYEEIQKIKSQKIYQPVEVDQALAYYYVQEGEVAKAREILVKYESELKDQFGYILNYAGILSRAGDLDKAIQYFYKAHLLRPKDQSGRNALYQAAFLSYQNRNYDTAEKRFQEFLQKYSKSGLTQDAKWHLAWIKYLKKDYQKAIADFKTLEDVKVKSKGSKQRRKIVIQQDRNKYWLAMAYLKLKKYDEAKLIFESLARDPLFGYYSIAAQARLLHVKKEIAKSNRSLAFTPVRISRFHMSDYVLPGEDQTTA
ncbi:MAG: tetratricopeptide repeat protein, partial [Pseudobdellovibrionaceae bacterium]